MCTLSIIGLVRGRFPESFVHAQTVDTRPLFHPPTWPGYEAICDPLSKNPALRANIEFELEAILSVQVVSLLNSDYYTSVSQGAWTVSY